MLHRLTEAARQGACTRVRRTHRHRVLKISDRARSPAPQALSVLGALHRGSTGAIYNSSCE